MKNKSIRVIKYIAMVEIDQVAGAMRAEYLTTAPFQEVVYAAKLAEARDFIKSQAGGLVGPAPPYVAADSAAYGKSPINAARGIVAAALRFHATTGPEIERERLGGKAAVWAAGNSDGEIASAASTAIGRLRNIQG